MSDLLRALYITVIATFGLSFLILSIANPVKSIDVIEQQTGSKTYDIYFVDGSVEKVRSEPLYLEVTGCVHLVTNQRFPKYCFVKKIILLD